MNNYSTAYYARPMSLYGTKQEARDKQAIERLGFAVLEINTPEIQAEAKLTKMDVFKPLVQRCAALFYRSFIDGRIGAGVAAEIQWAHEIGLPIMEFPRLVNQRTLDVEETRQYLRELGLR